MATRKVCRISLHITLELKLKKEWNKEAWFKSELSLLQFFSRLLCARALFSGVQLSNQHLKQRNKQKQQCNRATLTTLSVFSSLLYVSLLCLFVRMEASRFFRNFCCSTFYGSSFLFLVAQQSLLKLARSSNNKQASMRNFDRTIKVDKKPEGKKLAAKQRSDFRSFVSNLKLLYAKKRLIFDAL